MYAAQLKTNYMSEPIGIDPGKVVFSWIPTQGITQTAFHVIVRDENETLFNSGKILSNKSEYVPGIEIPSQKQIFWSVILWDETGTAGTEISSFFETGIGQNDWRAAWISPELTELPKNVTAADPLNRASYLHKYFQVSEVSHARLYITAHGIYDVWINGKHIDGYFLAPGASQYPKRLQVQTYDIKDALVEGENEIVVSIGDGWWRGCLGWPMKRNTFGTQLALLCQIEVNGAVAAVTDGTWEASQNGPLGLNDMMQLEQYDATVVIDDWHSVIVEDWDLDNLVGTCLPVKPQERFAAKLIITPKGEKVLDFGQNFAGYAEFDLMAKGGEKILLTFIEALDKDGNFQTTHNQNPDSPYCFQKLEYTCKEGRNIYHQTKCYYGFQYVKVETELEITGEEFIGVAVYSDMKQTGFFECGNADVNQLFKNSVWSMKSNFVDIPTDCPHREKSGFSGDCQAFSDTAMYLMDCYPVLARWLKEQAATQFENGCVKQIAPDMDYNEFDGSAGWCDSFEIVPWRIMKLYNSTEFISELYPQIRDWMLFCIHRAKDYREDNASMPEIYRDYFVDCARHWGEWKEPFEKDYYEEGSRTGHAEIATAYLSYGCYMMSEMAERLGKTEDAEFFRDAGEKAKNAYRYAFVKDGRIYSDRQCHYVRPLAMNLLTEEEKKQAAADLVKLIHEQNGLLGTGFLTTYELCNVLTDNGQVPAAFDLLLNTKQPSWLFQIKKGANTIWESWFGMSEDGTPMGSLNHYTYGSISGWLMSRVAGITVTDGKILIQPCTDERLGFAEGTYLSPFGKIYSSWKYEDGKIRYDIEIPTNITAKIILPNGETHEVSTGKYTYFTH